MALTAERDPDKLRELLDESMPVRTRTSSTRSRPGPPGFAGPAHGFRVGAAGSPTGWLPRTPSAVAAFNAAESVEVQRMAKNGLRTFDARSAVAVIPGSLFRRRSVHRLIGLPTRFVRYRGRLFGTHRLPFDPTTSRPVFAPWLTLRRRSP
ncbi:hypothetical protein ACRAWF_34725 [Streptomyces sp. L7]